MILRDFPTHLPARDSRNLIVAARGADVAYPEHAGALSIKCVFQGREIYEVNGARHAVDEASYLLLNNGQRYSCHIRSEREAEVFLRVEEESDEVGSGTGEEAGEKGMA